MSAYVISPVDQFAVRATKLAAIRQGYSVVPENWFDCIICLNGHYVGVSLQDGIDPKKVANMLANCAGEVGYFRNSSGQRCLGVSYNERDETGNICFAGCDIFGTVVFVEGVQIGYTPT